MAIEDNLANIKLNEKLAQLNSEIKIKNDELLKLNREIDDASKEKESKETELNNYTLKIQKAIDILLRKKDDYELLQNDINKANNELVNIKNDIKEKRTVNSVGESLIGKINISELSDDLKDIKKMISRARFSESIEAIKKAVYWLYKENSNLRNELKINAEIVPDTGNFDDLKKQLRIKKTEIREYQQKIEQEISLRKRFEEEIKSLKNTIKNNSALNIRPISFTVLNINNSKETEIYIEKNIFKFNQQEFNINNIYVRELKSNELHHLAYKKRPLCLQIYFLKEITKSTSSGTRRSLKALESDLAKENKIIAGLKSLMNILEGKTKEEAKAQLEGSEKKLEQLQDDIEKAKRSTLTEFEVDDDEKVYEFNNHLFYEKTVAKGTLCDHCNEVLYGIVNQALCCKDCLMIVHKSCYVLGDISCELNRAMKAGSNVSVLCKTSEDKEKLLQLRKLY